MMKPKIRISIGPFELECSSSDTELIERILTLATTELDRRHAARETRYLEEAEKNAAVMEVVAAVAPWLESLLGNRRPNDARPDTDADTSGDVH